MMTAANVIDILGGKQHIFSLILMKKPHPQASKKKKNHLWFSSKRTIIHCFWNDDLAAKKLNGYFSPLKYFKCDPI